MSDRRQVRPTRKFFEQLGEHLPVTRGEDGTASCVDFQTYELFSIIGRFATGWDGLPELISGRPEYRILISQGRVVFAYSVVGRLCADGVVELVHLKIDRVPPAWDVRDGEG